MKRGQLGLVLGGVVLGALTLGLAGCGNNDTAAFTDPGPQVAKVNDTLISRWAMEDLIARQGPMARVSRDDALEELIDMALLRQAAEQRGLDQDLEIQRQLDQLRTNVLANHYVQRFMDEQDFTETALRAEYEAQIAAAGDEEFRARHILVDDADLAADLIAQLAAGADFVALAREHSTDTTANRGGDLGWFQLDMMVTEFAEALAQLTPGQVTAEPVQSRFGWHVIELQETRALDLPAFEEVIEALQQILANRALQSELELLRQRATIERY